MLSVEKVVDDIYLVHDEDYTTERLNVLLNFLEEFSLNILDYKISLNVKGLGTCLYSHDFQVFNIDEPIENTLGNVDMLFKEVIDELDDNNYDFSVSVLGIKTFKPVFPLKEEYSIKE